MLPDSKGHTPTSSWGTGLSGRTADHDACPLVLNHTRQWTIGMENRQLQAKWLYRTYTKIKWITDLSHGRNWLSGWKTDCESSSPILKVTHYVAIEGGTAQAMDNRQWRLLLINEYSKTEYWHQIKLLTYHDRKSSGRLCRNNLD